MTRFCIVRNRKVRCSKCGKTHSLWLSRKTKKRLKGRYICFPCQKEGEKDNE